jgi:hypothetical protein
MRCDALALGILVPPERRVFVSGKRSMVHVACVLWLVKKRGLSRCSLPVSRVLRYDGSGFSTTQQRDADMSNLEQILQSIDDAVRAKYGDAAHREGFIVKERLGGHIDKIVELEIDANGHGHTQLKQTTLGVTITGTAQIVSPCTGEWNIKIVADGKTVLFDRAGLTCDTAAVPFSYTTGLKLTLDIDAQWTPPNATTLKAHIVADY